MNKNNEPEFKLNIPPQPRPIYLEKILGEFESMSEDRKTKITKELGEFYKALFYAEGAGYELPEPPKSFMSLDPQLRSVLNAIIDREFLEHWFAEGFMERPLEERMAIYRKRREENEAAGKYLHLPEQAEFEGKILNKEDLKKLVDDGIIAPNNPKASKPHIDLSKPVVTIDLPTIATPQKKIITNLN